MKREERIAQIIVNLINVKYEMERERIALRNEIKQKILLLKCLV